MTTPGDPESSEIATLELGGFDRHGTTRARVGERWIEVEHGIPGETVQAQIVGRRRPRGHIVQMVHASPDRVEPPCPYFRDWACGGCQWQQISYSGQLSRKRAEVEGAMQEVGIDLAVTAVHALDEPWRYRSTATISLGRSAGFRRQASLAIVPIRDCPISHPLIGRLMATLNDLLAGGELPDYRGRVRVDVRVAGTPDAEYLQALVRTEGDESRDSDLHAVVDRVAELDFVGSVARLTPDGRPQAVKGDLFGEVPVAGQQVTLSAASFFQTNLRLLPELIRRLQEEASPLRGKRVADVYGGIGIFGSLMAAEAQDVVIVESDPVAVEAGRLTAQTWERHNVEFVVGRAEEVLEDAGHCDVVIVDPPRSGLGEDVRAELLSGRSPLILYVSCLAQSLARDLAVLTAGGYRVHHLELFDFYPQTYHVELLAVLRRT